MDNEHKLPLKMKFVYVEWIDSVFPDNNGWMTPTEIDDFTNTYKDGIVYTVGMLYSESNTFLTLVNSVGSQGQQCAGILMIPHCAIIRICQVLIGNEVDEDVWQSDNIRVLDVDIGTDNGCGIDLSVCKDSLV